MLELLEGIQEGQSPFLSRQKSRRQEIQTEKDGTEPDRQGEDMEKMAQKTAPESEVRNHEEI